MHHEDEVIIQPVSLILRVSARVCIWIFIASLQTSYFFYLTFVFRALWLLCFFASILAEVFFFSLFSYLSFAKDTVVHLYKKLWCLLCAHSSSSKQLFPCLQSTKHKYLQLCYRNHTYSDNIFPIFFAAGGSLKTPLKYAEELISHFFSLSKIEKVFDNAIHLKLLCACHFITWSWCGKYSFKWLLPDGTS